MDSLAYLPGDEPSKTAPLARYLPPVPEGVAAGFLAQYLARSEAQPNAWILDPFGASPGLAAEIARQGYRVLAAVNNPVGRFLLEMAARPPTQADLRLALSELAAARKGDERLETHLQSLYLTECSKCQRQVPVEAFVWERQGKAPLMRIYHCECGEGGEFPVNDADEKRAEGMAAMDGLHRARALERVAAPNDPDRKHAEEALECYLPRPIYALITILNKLDGITLSPESRKALYALVLGACDEASSLWPHPSDRPRPKQLGLPPRFLEKNVWLALEHGVALWSEAGEPVQVVNWPELPGQEGGLCLFDGAMRDLAPQLKGLSISAVVTALPRPNQAFWTLSALWAGWLWGREATAAFKSVLRRRRYDWNWHTAALYAALKNLAERLPLNTPLFAIIPELEPALLSAGLLSAAGAGFALQGLALRTRQDPAQVLWHRQLLVRSDKQAPAIDADLVRQAMLIALQERSEPAPYLNLHAAGLAAMAGEQSLAWRPEALSVIHAPIQAGLSAKEFVHQSDSTNLESGLWALAQWDDNTEPLTDRVEIAIVQFLQKHPGCTFRELERTVNAGLPGLLTPSLGQLHAILTSYAIEQDGHWSLRPEDTPANRRVDLEFSAGSLAGLGERLGYVVRKEETPRRLIDWEENGREVYRFHLLASALVTDLLRRNPAPGLTRFLVLPDARLNLLQYKLEFDPALKSAAGHWRILPFNSLRKLTGTLDITREQFEKGSSGDSIEDPGQMKLF